MQKHIVLLILCIAGFASCEREKCETATVKGLVRHHALNIPNATVYIKKGSKNAPADPRNPKSYDDSTKADGSASYSFSGLAEGDYYLVGIGYDSAIAESVFGGTPLTIACKPTKETVNLNVAVVE
jgi:hypothetical protein